MKLHGVLFCVLIFVCRAEDCKDKGPIDHEYKITDDYFTSMIRPYLVREFRPWRYVAAPNDLEPNVMKTNDDKFEFNIDVQHFAPSELSVKVADGYVVVEAKHEEKKDNHGLVSRQLVRRYSIPDGVEPEEVVAQLSSDGILAVSAPRNIDGHSERTVPIVPTGPKRKDKKEPSCDDCNNEI